jgi:hypothetical protein
MPGLESAQPSYSGTNMWYSFDYANMHFVGISTEPSTEASAVGTQQYQWMEQDLESAIKRKQNDEIDWIFVMGHRPMYCSYNWSDCCHMCNQQAYHREWDKDSFAANLRKNLEELMLESQVDMYLSGHIHAYERMWPGIKSISIAITYELSVYQSIVEKNNHPDLYINPRYTVHTMTGQDDYLWG